MAHPPGTPAVLRGGLVGLAAPGWQPDQVVVFQYNPETLRRTVAPAATSSAATPGVAPGGGERLELALVFDASEDLEDPAAHPGAATLGVLPRLEALQAIAFPAPAAPARVLLLVFGARRPLPVRVAALTIDEEAFGPSLGPLRARARLELEVLQASELPGALAQALARPGPAEGALLAAQRAVASGARTGGAPP